jgi:hypothetical protein
MRIVVGILGVLFILLAFVMTSWHYKGETVDREPTVFARTTTFGIGVLSLALAFWWPF